MPNRGLFLRRRGHPARWPLSLLLALMLLVALLGTPRAWLHALLGARDEGARRPPADPRPWLVLVRPPEIVVGADRRDPPVAPPPPPPAVAPADWWREGLRVRIAADLVRAPRATADDSVRYLLQTLGLPPDPAALVRPDSQLAVRLLLLRRQDDFRFDALKPYLGALTRARAYADIQSRAADMYDQFLGREIMVPD
jgi:hypothetical protein